MLWVEFCDGCNDNEFLILCDDKEMRDDDETENRPIKNSEPKRKNLSESMSHSLVEHHI